MRCGFKQIEHLDGPGNCRFRSCNGTHVYRTAIVTGGLVIPDAVIPTSTASPAGIPDGTTAFI